MKRNRKVTTRMLAYIPENEIYQNKKQKIHFLHIAKKSKKLKFHVTKKQIHNKNENLPR